MSRIKRTDALRRGATAVKMRVPDATFTLEKASYCSGAIALDFGSRILYCSELHAVEIVSPFATKEEVIEKIKGLIERLETKRNAEAQKTI